MLVVTENGFAMVSEVFSSYHDSLEKGIKGNAGFSTTFLSNSFLKGELNGKTKRISNG